MNINPVSYRLMKPEDSQWVKKAWSSSEHDMTAARIVPHSVYKTDEEARVSYMLSTSVTMVAYLDKEPDTLISFMTYQIQHNRLYIHYAFTKSSFRRQGIIKDMIDNVNIFHFPIVATCTPPNGNILSKHFNNAIYDHFYFTRKFYL